MEDIRPAGASDLDAMLGLQAAWPLLPRWNRAHLEAALAGGRERLLVCQEGSELAGFVAVRLLPPEAEVTVIAVRPERLRRGIARRLLERAHSLAREAGCGIVGLEVSATNVPAIAFYDGAGYRIVGRRTKYYNDGSDALLMSLRLP